MKERSTSEGEWCDTSPDGGDEGDSEAKRREAEEEDAGKSESELPWERIWPSA